LGLTACASSSGGSGTAGSAPLAQVEQGRLRGSRNGAVVSFKRVPYATNPYLSATRFQAPQPMPAWPGERDATALGPMPPQPSRTPGGGMAGDADDLTLNIWAPVHAQDAPVLVWLPGGAFYRVDAAEDWYDGSAFARQGIVVVVVNYRVGIDGFLALDGMPANRGLLDQVAALKWVQRNIAAFGGSPNKVTLAGQSAGAQSVMMLMGMPTAKGLFHQAIAQSPPQNHFTPEQARRITNATAEVLKVAPTAQALAAVPLPQMVAATESMVADMRNAAKWGPIGGQPPFLPVVDGSVVTASPLSALQANTQVPLVIGCTDEEARLYMVPGGAIDRIPEPALAQALRDAKLPANAADVYAQARPNASPGDQLAALESDKTFRMPTQRYAEQRVQVNAPVWLYHFSWASPAFGGRLGAAHVVDVPFVFNTLASKQAAPFLDGSGHQPLADAMHREWTHFIQKGSVSWPRYELTHRPTMRFDATPSTVADPMAARRLLWSGVRFD
jgi:para-nitrobenzyl esterase